MDQSRVRALASALGLSVLAFGAMPLLAPRQFARLFGFAAPEPAVVSMMRSLGVRDAVMGVGLWSAATHGGRYAPWLLARVLIDAGDTAAVGLAVAPCALDVPVFPVVVCMVGGLFPPVVRVGRDGAGRRLTALSGVPVHLGLAPPRLTEGAPASCRPPWRAGASGSEQGCAGTVPLAT